MILRMMIPAVRAPATALITALITAGLLASTAQADTLVTNIEGITINTRGEVERFTGLVFDEEGRITEVLVRGEEPATPTQYQIDGKGRVMLPGMIDAHLHIMELGLSALTLDLSDTRSLEEALAAIESFAKDNPGRPWILGRGWDQAKWGLERFPTAAELDAVVPGRPAYLTRMDGHAGWANSRAMERAGVTAALEAPSGGRVIRAPGSHAPQGVFVDAAQALITKAIPTPRAAELDLAFQKAQALLHANGVTAAADMGTRLADWHTFRRAGDNGRLTLRIMAYAPSIEVMSLIAGPAPTPWLYDDRLRLNGVTLSLDGALNSRGALLKEPYADEPGHKGLMLLSSAQLRNLMSRAAMDDFQIAVRAAGDGANAEVLQAIEELSATYAKDRRWRIEHAQIVDHEDIAAFARHGIIASMQPAQQTLDRLMAEARLGPERLEGAYAWRSIATSGARLAFGSDAPARHPNPFAGIAAAISRTDANDEPFGGWQAQETVTREAALRAYTADAAFAGMAQGRFGRIVKGERADFILIDRDPFLLSPRDIRTIRVVETWVAGRKVFDADQ